jgi:hypothetical protein
MRNPVKSNAQLINYSHHSKYPICICNPVIEKSFSSQTNNANISNSQRISNILTSSVGGRTQFVNRNESFLSINSNNSVIGIHNSLLGLGPRNKF